MRSSFLHYARPAMGDDEVAAVESAMRNGWLTTGPRTAIFEEAFTEKSGVPHAVALNSCTAGIHLALAALDIGAGDDVIMPSFSFVAGAQCTVEVGARPVFCDVEADTLSVSLRTIAPLITERTKAIITMPYAGRPLGIEEVCAHARARGIAVIEDAAHAAGTLDRGKWPGTRSTAAIFSFYATKNLSTGEGGMLLTNDSKLAARVRRLALHGMSRDAWGRYTEGGSWRYDVLEPGFKYNMSDIAASIGVAQLERLEALQQRRDEIASRYIASLRGVRGLSFQRFIEGRDDRMSWCMFAILIDERITRVDRDQLVKELRRRKIGTSVHYIPTHWFTAYRKMAGRPLPNTEAIAGRILSLPLYPGMSDGDVTDVAEAVREVLAPTAAAQSKPILTA